MPRRAGRNRKYRRKDGEPKAAAGASPDRAELAPAFAASSSSSASAAAPSRPLAELEDVVCSACHEAFECADESAHLPRTLPCGHPMCSGCIKQSLSLTPGSVLCPHEHGQSKISVPAGVAAAAVSMTEDWLGLMPPATELIAAIRIQHQLRTQLRQQQARCSRSGCESAVTHYCCKCLDLCAEHERLRHAALPSHVATTVVIAQKELFLRDQSQSEIAEAASAIRSRTEALLRQQQLKLQSAEAEVKQAEAALLTKKRALQTNAQAVSALQQRVDRMRSADDDTVIEMHAGSPMAPPAQLPVAPAFCKRDSTVLNTVSNGCVAELQTFLPPGRSLSNATLIYRASRDGFEAKDWWRLCAGRSNTLTLVRVKSNGFVFGAFAAFQWPAVAPVEPAQIADPTGTTFLFSLVNARGRAVKLRLKEGQASGRVYQQCGPFFGNDLSLMFDFESADSPSGNWTQPYWFEFDSVADGGKPIPYDKTLLAGDDGEDSYFVQFAAAEMETWQL